MLPSVKYTHQKMNESKGMIITKVRVEVAQLCPTLCDPMDCTVYGLLQARILEWVAFPFSKGSPKIGLPRCRRILYQLSHKGSP